MDDDIERVLREFALGGPPDLTRAFTPIQADTPYFAGAVQVPAIGLDQMGAFVIPTGSGRGVMDYTHVYMVIDDYISVAGSGLDADVVQRTGARTILNMVRKDHLILGLGVLSGILGRPEETDAVVQALKEMLHPDARARLETALRGEAGGHSPIARQPLLAAFKLALTEGNDQVETQLPPEVGAMVLTHAVAASLTVGLHEGAELIGGLPDQFAVDMVINHGFNSSEDTLAVLDRTIRTWRDYGPAVAGRFNGTLPTDLIVEATGLDLEDFLAMAFAVWAHRLNWKLGDPQLVNPQLYPGMDQGRWNRFLDLLAGTPEELAQAIEASRSSWDFLAFQSRPLLRLNEGLLLIDVVFLIEKATSGLFWLVHDYLRNQSDARRQTWSHAWGDMIEALCEDSLRPFAPPILGGGTTFYTEDDLATAYRRGKRADVVIDFGEIFGAFEIVSGQLKTETRIDGSPDALREDLERLLYKKIRQLDETSRNLLEDPGALTGSGTNPNRVQPTVVTVGLPVNPVTINAATAYCEETGRLIDPRILPLAIIDVGELEMLEGLTEIGYNPVELLQRWRASNLANISFRNWLLAEFGNGQFLRPARMKPRFDALTNEMVHRLGFTRPDTGDPPLPAS